jgi:hypothetical protein
MAQAPTQAPKSQPESEFKEFFELVRRLKENPRAIHEVSGIAVRVSEHEVDYVKIDHSKLAVVRAYYNEESGVAEIKLVYTSGLVVRIGPNYVVVYSLNSDYPY